MTTENTAQSQEAQQPQAIDANGVPHVSREMVYAAMKEAVKQGIFPSHAAGEDDYLKKHAQMAAVLHACHQAQPEAFHDSLTWRPHTPQRVMERAHALCPTDAPHRDRMAWIADYYEKNRPASKPHEAFAYHNPENGEFLAASFGQRPEGWDQLSLMTDSADAPQVGQATHVNEVIRDAIEAAFEQRAGWRQKIAAAVRALPESRS